MAMVDMFIRIGKPREVKGEAVDKTHAGEIDVLSFSWGAQSNHSPDLVAQGRATVTDLSFRHYIDSATPILWSAIKSNKYFEKATLTLRKAGHTPLEYLVIEMKDVLVSSVKLNGTGDDVMKTEDVTLKFGAFTMTYTPQKKEGTPDNSIVASWEIRSNA